MKYQNLYEYVCLNNPQPILFRFDCSYHDYITRKKIRDKNEMDYLEKYNPKEELIEYEIYRKEEDYFHRKAKLFVRKIKDRN